MIKAGLVVEGGGMRGVYSSGVLDFFIEKDLFFENNYGVSAGACHLCSYLAKQYKRAFRVNVDYLNDKRYCSVHSLLKTGNLFGAEMLYDIIPNELDLFDYDTYNKNESNFYVVITNINTGKPEYVKIGDLKKDIIYVRASSSLPLLAQNVKINDKEYLDGGISDSIPIKKSIADGNKKNVVILTRDNTYRKGKNSLMPIIKLKYKKYPNFVKSMADRYIVYNEILDFIKELEDNGDVFVIRPKKPVNIGRTEKNREKLEALYNDGYNDAKDCYEELLKYLGKENL
ncbi:patatin-like phospholipase family protein [Intestinibacter bartlettii]|uniref:patatin-like phospholipase family protein n=1 Tax=Intestinibacter bartlettii TaxID=261299 RepID=UPI001D122C2B|nr:patatin family protein [Intestinibacter bartlettii]MCC2705308.1 patatin family protein [Intestinibacter bartlettii]MCC2760758.1 patatin family protein [Intestinibacter bartlettii]MDU6472746.1 patatin family protein [Intestinibacter bartlettii]